MELVKKPQFELDRMELNKKENKPAGFVGEAKLYVGNVAFETTEAQMYEQFSEHGIVGEVSLVYDNETGRPRGFAFITMRTKDGAEKCLEALNGKEIMGRNISVRPANN